MRLYEITQTPISAIKDYLVFLKIKGVFEVDMNTIVNELRQKGILVSGKDIMEIVHDIDFVTDASETKISLNDNTVNDNEKDEEAADEDLDKKRVSNMARSAISD